MNAVDKFVLGMLKHAPAKEACIMLHARSRNLSEIMRMLPRGCKVLDVGCGLGLTGEHLARKGYSVRAIEADKALVKGRAAMLPYPVFCASAEKMPFANESFDAVVFAHVLHHIPKAKHAKAMGETARVLKKGGKMIIIEPKVGAVFDEVWDEAFFSKNFHGYFTPSCKYKCKTKRGARMFEINREEIGSLKFNYHGGKR